MARFQELTVQDLLVEKFKTLDGSSTITIDDNISFSDSEGVIYGTGSDVSTYWNGTQFVIAPTTGFWADCPWTDYPNPSVSYNYFEDFIGLKVDDQSAKLPLEWKVFNENSATITEAAGGLGGVLALVTGGTGDNAVGIALGFEGTQNHITYVAASGKKSWVEWRVSTAQLENDYSLFVGLASEGSCVDNFIDDAHTDYDNKDVLGFTIWAADGDAIDCNMQEAGAGFVDVGLAGVPVAGTMVTLGLYFDGASTLSFYYNGSSVQTVTVASGTTGFPYNDPMTPMIYLKTNATATAKASVDWFKMVVER